MKVSIYAAKVTGLPTDTSLYKSLIDNERLTRSQKFSQHIDKQLCLGAGLLLARALRSQYPQTPLPIKLDYGTVGKPALNSAEAFHFNISHSGHWVVCAVATAPTGVDIELVSRDMADVARHYFSPAERAYIAALPQAEQLPAFYDFWVIKESYMKATGQGFNILPQILEVHFHPGPLKESLNLEHLPKPHSRLPSSPRLRRASCRNDSLPPRHSDLRAGIFPLLLHNAKRVEYAFRLCEFFDKNYRLAFAVQAEPDEITDYTLIQVDCCALLSCLARERALTSEPVLNLKSMEKNYENISAVQCPDANTDHRTALARNNSL